MPQFDAYLNGKTDLAAAPAGTDMVPLVDVSDTTEDAGGTLKRVSVANLAAASGATLTAVEETTTARTLQLSDAGKVVESTNASATTITVPPNSSVAFPAGTVINVYSAGAGGVTIAAGSGVTIRNLSTLSQYGECSLRKRATDEWVQVG